MGTTKEVSTNSFATFSDGLIHTDTPVKADQPKVRFIKKDSKTSNADEVANLNEEYLIRA